MRSGVVVTPLTLGCRSRYWDDSDRRDMWRVSLLAIRACPQGKNLTRILLRDPSTLNHDDHGTLPIRVSPLRFYASRNVNSILINLHRLVWGVEPDWLLCRIHHTRCKGLFLSAKRYTSTVGSQNDTTHPHPCDSESIPMFVFISPAMEAIVLARFVWEDLAPCTYISEAC